MKLRTLLPAVLAAFSTTAFAANVELYGIVDAYVQVYNGGNGTVVDLGSGGKAGSRWGIKGTEDLGGGNSVFFRLENGFMLDNGTNSPATGGNGYAFQRESVLGVKGGWVPFPSAVSTHSTSAVSLSLTLSPAVSAAPSTTLCLRRPISRALMSPASTVCPVSTT